MRSVSTTLQASHSRPVASDLRPRASPTAGALVLLVLASAVWLAPSSPARASSYCRKVRARSASEAALLMSPQLALQAARYPSDPSFALSPAESRGFQARAGLSFSPLDFYRGLRVLSLGDADCAQQASHQSIEELLARGEDGVRLAALRQEVAFLEAHRAEWQAILTTVEERLAAKLVSLMEFNYVDEASGALEGRLSEARGQLRRLEARLPEAPELPPDTLREQYAERTLGFEREESRLRKLQAWDLELAGGLAAHESFGWFGSVQLSFKPGAFVQQQHESRYLAARGEELANARYEVDQRLLRQQAEARAAREQTERDLARVEKQLATLERTWGVLECSESPNSLHARDLLALERLAVRADQVFLRATLEALAAFR